MLRWALATVCTAAAVSGCAAFAATGASPASNSTPPNAIYHLTESMLIDEGAVPALDGTTWGQMVATPQGTEPSVSPQKCGLFLSQTGALEKGIAIRSAMGAAIGVELAIIDPRPDLIALFDDCRTFTIDVEGGQSSVQMQPLDFDDLPNGAVGVLQHCATTRDGQTVEWDIATIFGYHRGVLVEAEYTPGPRGEDFDNDLAASIGDIFQQQLARLDGS